jgi:thiol:disulfide interchange protein DsbC
MMYQHSHTNIVFNGGIRRCKALAVAVFAAVAFSLCAAALAQTQEEAAVRKALSTRLGPDFRIDSVLRSPIAGVYEVRLGTDVFYVDAKAENLIMGHIQDLKTGKNYTQERLDALATEAVFSPVNKSNALKLVKGNGGNGKRDIVLFEDVHCGYCKKMRAELDKLNNVTIYTYLIPILSADSEVKMRGVWCAKDRNKAYDDWMLRGVSPPVADERCAVPVEANQTLAQGLRVRGTPSVFFQSGKRIPGYVEAAQIEQNLNPASTASK